ncbi:hypothetical protein ILUMI_20508 [Ignelater luminosus]|uniref:Complex I assembly factor TIMMDC1, mitochondrial n=1 Tax=Ignelater luminosus TaxID=2038154 RepID=A0A8K0G283_IGNLU|nr:hypothetical protein ILUMI_20508 [Ignelater luminosus]
MIRSNIKKIKLLSFTLPFGYGTEADIVTKDTKTVQDADLSIVKEETGWERLQQMFKKDDFGRISPELHTVLQVGTMSMFIGAIYGGTIHSRESYLDFIKNNQATAFKSHLDAKKKLQDQVTLSFAKGAFKWGWRLTYFCTTYVAVSTSLAVYRGKNGILEHLAAGAVAGSTYKFQMGPRGWIVGGGLGIVLGAIAGVITTSLLKLTGMSMEEVRYWNYKWAKARTDSYNREFGKHLEKESLLLLTEREARSGNLDNLEKVAKDNNVNIK